MMVPESTRLSSRNGELRERIEMDLEGGVNRYNYKF